jgi:hypothetical protein
MESEEFPKLIFLDWQEGDEIVINQKGWFCHNVVELANGNRYQVCFFDKSRLVHELNYREGQGKPFFIENALIVLSEVTIENMKAAIIEAEKQKFFENLKPIQS